MEAGPLTQVLVAVFSWYGIWILSSLAQTFLFRRFLVMPILAPCGILAPRIIWKDSAVWGFWLAWQYAVAVVLLLGYKSVFFVIRKLTRFDASTALFWNEKERTYLQSTPRTLLRYWVIDRYGVHYLWPLQRIYSLRPTGFHPQAAA